MFKADTVLAKHDENYMPKDVADALKKQGLWKEDSGAKPDVDANKAEAPRAAQADQATPRAAERVSQ